MRNLARKTNRHITALARLGADKWQCMLCSRWTEKAGQICTKCSNG